MKAVKKNHIDEVNFRGEYCIVLSGTAKGIVYCCPKCEERIASKMGGFDEIKQSLFIGKETLCIMFCECKWVGVLKNGEFIQYNKDENKEIIPKKKIIPEKQITSNVRTYNKYSSTINRRNPVKEQMKDILEYLDFIEKEKIDLEEELKRLSKFIADK